MTGTATTLEAKEANRAASLQKYNEIVQKLQQSDASDVLYIYKSSYDYNPTADLKKIKAQIFAINFKDDLINPVELLHLPKLSNLHHIMQNGGYGHLSFEHSVLWIKPLEKFLKNLPGWEYLKTE